MSDSHFVPVGEDHVPANDRIADEIEKERKTAQQRIDKKRAKVIAKLAMAEKHRSFAWPIEGPRNEGSLKIRMPIKPLPKPRRELPCAGPYTQFYVNSRLNLQNGWTAVPMPVSYARPGEDGVRVELGKRPGVRNGTRVQKGKSFEDSNREEEGEEVMSEPPDADDYDVGEPPNADDY